ncbi:MAG: SDR family oxidoreductase [Chloroflexi bacterium]|nr:SDR family oxidoreductase [Chloroflexota bacterium]
MSEHVQTTDPFAITNRVVMVTGAAGGIGREVVTVLLRAGARVSASDLPRAPLSELAESAASARLVTHAADLANADAAADWFSDTLRELGPVDALVNVAGAWHIRPLLEVSAADVELMLDANFRTAFNCCRAVAPHMLERGNGSIVNFASTAGQYGSISPAAHYAAAKGAVIAMTKSLARELSPHGIRVNAVSPGPIDTEALAAGRPIDRAAVADRTLVGRLGTPADIAHAVLFLVSDGSSFITGHVLNVNGGSLL